LPGAWSRWPSAPAHPGAVLTGRGCVGPRGYRAEHRGGEMPVNTTFGGESAARSRSVALGRVGRAELHRGLSIAATTPGERFLEAYRAARTAAGALLAPGPRRRGPSDVWHRFAAEHPD